jgi:ATP-dependent RNA helicase RhlE
MDFSEEYHIGKIQKLIKQTIERIPMPEVIKIHETPFDEFQDQMREIDRQKKLENPDYKGAFHEKKQRFDVKKKVDKKGKPKRRKR